MFECDFEIGRNSLGTENVNISILLPFVIDEHSCQFSLSRTSKCGVQQSYIMLLVA